MDHILEKKSTAFNQFGFPVAQAVKNLPAMHETGIPSLGLILEEGNGYPLQLFLPGEFHDTGAWWTTVHGVTKSWTGLSD